MNDEQNNAEASAANAGSDPLGRATYSPEDNKIRLYPFTRLSRPDYDRVKAAGFKWAPKQDLFVAPMWTPEREDLAIELCGSLDDEDQSLVDRAEERADRFQDYSANRKDDAQAAQKYVASIADGIPMGQPILVGHHSEKHARRDAKRIENGMKRAIRMWDCAQYWTQRAKGALAAAKYKERPDVRARRIKTLEAEKRKQERRIAEIESERNAWRSVLRWLHTETERADAPDVAKRLADHYAGIIYDGIGDDYRKGKVSIEDCACQRIVDLDAQEPNPRRWLEHYDNRLAYENAMLADQGFEIDRKKSRSGASMLPLCNYRAKSIRCANRYHRGEFIDYPQIEMTAAEYKRIPPDYKGTAVCENSHRIRITMRNHSLHSVFLTDSATHEKPAPAGAMPKGDWNRGILPTGDPAPAAEPLPPGVYIPPAETKPGEPDRAEIEAMRDSLKAGVQVVSAPQLFPTPPDLAARVVELADIQPGHRILEPSAGTGNLVREMIHLNLSGFNGNPPAGEFVAVEINLTLAHKLAAEFPKLDVRRSDFLECTGELIGMFDRIVMNPPFERGADIKHVEHAITLLNPGGRLVTICANGPRQREAFATRGQWIDLPSGSFASEGTNVNAAIFVFDAPDAPDRDPVEKIPEGRTIWNSNGSDGPCLVCPPPVPVSPARVGPVGQLSLF